MWIETIIMPREESESDFSVPGQRDRRAVLQAANAESCALRDAVVGFLGAHGLLDAVKWMSEPGFLPVITLHCTDYALEKLREAAEFVVGCAAPIEVYHPLVGAQPQVSPEALLPALSMLEPRL